MGDGSPDGSIIGSLLAGGNLAGGLIGLIIALVVLVVLSGVFSATETAYTSFSTVRMRRIAQKKRTARVALKMSEDFNRVLTTLLIGNNIVNIAAASISTVDRKSVV